MSFFLIFMIICLMFFAVKERIILNFAPDNSKLISNYANYDL